MSEAKVATIEVKLTPEELTALNGKCREEVQVKVDEAMMAIGLRDSGLAEREALMVAKIITVARATGRLMYSAVWASSCPCCGRRDGYQLVRRSTRYKRRGEKDYDRPLLHKVYDLDRGCVTMRNTVFTGFCEGCEGRIRPVLAGLLTNVKAEVPQGITGQPSRFKRYDNRKCAKCGWVGHEGEMRQLRMLMGDGYYPGGCPKCDGKNVFLGGTVIETAPGFTLVPAQ